jgi:hypothetical protein
VVNFIIKIFYKVFFRNLVLGERQDHQPLIIKKKFQLFERGNMSFAIDHIILYNEKGLVEFQGSLYTRQFNN